MLEHKKEYYLLLILGVVSWWLVDVFTVEIGGSEEAPPHSPDYFSMGYTKIEMDATGVAVSKLNAKRMQHFADDGTIEMQQPVMIFYNKEAPPWVVHSDKGILSADRKDLFLQGKVLIIRQKAENTGLIKVNTTNLSVRPDDKYAQTGDWAELIAPPNWVSGIGMKVFFQQPVYMEFFSRVRSRYETM